MIEVSAVQKQRGNWRRKLCSAIRAEARLRILYRMAGWKSAKFAARTEASTCIIKRTFLSCSL